MSVPKKGRKGKNGDVSLDLGENSGIDGLGSGSMGMSQSVSASKAAELKIKRTLDRAHKCFDVGRYLEAQEICDQVYETDAFRTDNLLLLGAVHFQLANYSESIFYNQQCIRVDPSFAEAYSNLGNALKELGDIRASIQFYNKAIRLKPRYSDAYNNLACAYLQNGELEQAMETYQMALVLNPTLVDAHSNLGNLCKAKGDMDSAKKCFLEAIRIKPDFAIAWSNLAGVFKHEGQVATAVAYYKEAVRLSPEFADAHSNLGNALKEQGEIDDAIASYQTAIKLRPDFAVAHGNLATCHYDRGEYQEAIRNFKYAIQLEPGFPDAYNNLGNAYRELGQLDEAINSYRSCLRLKQDHPHAYNNLGNAMKDKGLVKESIHCYVTAIRLMPHFAAAHSNLGIVLKEQGKVDQALAHYHEAIAIEPLFADAYSNLGNAYKDTGKLEEAIKCYSTAIRLRPDFADAHANLGFALKDCGQLLESIESLERSLQLRPDYPEAFANLVHAKCLVCDWSTYDTDLARLSQLLEQQLMDSEGAKGITLGLLPLPAVQPFHTLSYPFALSEQLQIARRYAARYKVNVSLVEKHYRWQPRLKSMRIKVGYLSADFGNHPVSHLMQSVFRLHDRSRFEVTCYALNAADESSWRRTVESESEYFKDVSQLHHGDVAQLIQNDGIHILVDLTGYTKGAKTEVLALRPCLVQMSMMGYAGTSGADYMDYLIADPTSIPEESRSYYSEKILYMPHCSMVNDHRQCARFVLEGPKPSSIPIQVSRQQYGLSEDSFVFCNFSQAYKIDPILFETWMNILKRVPNSVLWLLRFPGQAESNLLDAAKERGVREDQLHFTDTVPKDEHLLRGFLADLCLDTVVCSGAATAMDILWSGTPMLTIEGDRMSARVGSSVLRAIGMDELVTTSMQAYEELAIALATDSDRLFEIRKKIENSRDSCALFDTERWVRNLEAGFEEAQRKQDIGMPPVDIRIEDDEPIAVVKEQQIAVFT